MQGFFGALAQAKANHGVMITTSSFSKDAADFANQVSDRIVLLDGEQLAALMIEHGVGVDHQVKRVPTVDRDYFEEG